MNEQEFPLVEPVNSFETVHPGMTLRDYFAGQILTSIQSENPALIASFAYQVADAMLAEREKSHVSN